MWSWSAGVVKFRETVGRSSMVMATRRAGWAISVELSDSATVVERIVISSISSFLLWSSGPGSG